MGIIADYAAQLDPARQAEIERISKIVYGVIPDAAEVTSYGMPAFKYKTGVVLGFAATKDFLSIYPFSGTTLSELKTELKDYSGTKSAVHLRRDRPLDAAVIEKIIRLRMAAIDAK